MVLDHVAERAGPVVVARPGSDAEILGDGDLDIGDPITIPDRLEQRIGEPEHQEVLDRGLAEVVIDPVDPALVKGLVEDGVERHRGLQVDTKGLLDHQTGPALTTGQARCAQAAHRGAEGRRGQGQVEDAVARQPVVSLDALDAPPQPVESVGSELVVVHHRVAPLGWTDPRGVQRHLAGRGLLDGVAGVGAELLLAERRAGNAEDEAAIDQPVLADQVIERRRQLLVIQVSGGAEHHQQVPVDRSGPDRRQ